MTTVAPEDGGSTLPHLPERYRVEHVIGRGGSAVVYAARDTLLNRPVAVKVFTAPTDSARVLREQQHEAQTLAGLSHHALVTLFDAGVDDRDPDSPHIYLVMERVDGPDLAQRLRSGPLTPMQVAYLGLDLCDALLYVHERGFLHRDIKPANVLLAARWSERRMRGKLSDFGIAAVLGAGVEDGEFTVGTAAYLSPEQVEGLPQHAPSDTYSLGLVLIQAATGRVAFPGGVLESAFARLERDPDVPASLPPRLADVLRGMTMRRPEDRVPLEDARELFEGVIVEELGKATPAPSAAGPVAAVARELQSAPPDPEFARITTITARTLRAPAAFAVLTTADTQSFACVPTAHRDELLRLALRCAAATEPGTWQVADLRADPRTAGAIVAAPVRSGAFRAVVAADGTRVGVLGVLDAIPREFDVDELATLADLALLVAHEVDLRQAVRRALFAR